MTAGIYLTANELEAMDGLSSLAVRLYLYLRQHMDLTTRMTGKIRRISFKSCREHCEEQRPKGQGVQIITPTLEQIRTAFSALARKGLAQPVQDGLVFLLARAKGIVRPAETQHESHSRRTRKNVSGTKGCQPYPQRPPRQTAHTSGGQGLYKKPGTVSLAPPAKADSPPTPDSPFLRLSLPKMDAETIARGAALLARLKMRGAAG